MRATTKRRARLRALLPALLPALLLAFGLPAAMAQDAAACLKDAQRLPFQQWPADLGLRPGEQPFPKQIRPKYPRYVAIPETDEERASLHPIFWPSEPSARLTIRGWVAAERFDCLEQAFRDLEGAAARFPDGQAKTLAFLTAMPEVVAMRNGMTERDVDALMERWRAAQPTSMLPDLLGPRLLDAAAWSFRGHETADKVAPEAAQLFRQLNARALERIDAVASPARDHLLWHHVALRAAMNNNVPVETLDGMTIAALKRFPDDPSLVLMAANPRMPQWGGSPRAFEAYAARMQALIGGARGDAAYALIYTRLMSMDAMRQHAGVRLDVVRRGLVESARSHASDPIQRLQDFACATRDAAAYREAQAQWAEYVKEPQLARPATDVDARCRLWLETLPAG